MAIDWLRWMRKTILWVCMWPLWRAVAAAQAAWVQFEPHCDSNSPLLSPNGPAEVVQGFWSWNFYDVSKSFDDLSVRVVAGKQSNEFLTCLHHPFWMEWSRITHLLNCHIALGDSSSSKAALTVHQFSQQLLQLLFVHWDFGDREGELTKNTIISQLATVWPCRCSRVQKLIKLLNRQILNKS